MGRSRGGADRGGLSGLLRVLRNHEDAVEADLLRFYRIDYLDRWRGGLSLRRISVLIQHLPPESALARLDRDGQPYWTLEAHLLDDLRMAETSTNKHQAKPHPSRPAPRRTKNDAKKVAAARRRAARRRDRIASGDLT